MDIGINHMLGERVKDIAILASHCLGATRLLPNPPFSCLTTILFHKFIFNGEPLLKARERLKFQCDWLRSNYNILPLSRAMHALPRNQLPERSLVITIDDAHSDVLEMIDIFRAFELPIAIFVCVGWSALASKPEEDTSIARVAAALELYNGDPIELDSQEGGLKLRVKSGQRHKAINQLIAQRVAWAPQADKILKVLWPAALGNSKRTCCTWAELSDLQRSGVEIGAHTITHPRLAEVPRPRLKFEIDEAHHILVKKFGTCEAFAYPFGTVGSYSNETSHVLAEAGYKSAFLTHADFASYQTDPYKMPRIVLPDRSISLLEFRARVSGGGAVFSYARNYFRLRA
jgi:peptidoglycan/xylan/chitin deacetylase (PgdA/CDA1 family)